MAYMNQERKAKLATGIKAIMPKDWKYSLSTDGYSITMTIMSAPVDLIAEVTRNLTEARRERGDDAYDYASNPIKDIDVNTHWLQNYFDDSLKTFEAIVKAMNEGNHNRSDSQTDYFDVGWYIHVKIGRWDKPFTVK